MSSRDHSRRNPLASTGVGAGIDAARHARASQLFVALDGLDPEQRAAVLERECSGDGELRREVESLLAQHDQDTPFLRRPIAEWRWSTLFDGERIGVTDGELASSERIGRYRVCSVVGRGGMGVVYLAEQDHPARTVALKLLRADTFSPARLRRFELEAEILGRLQHRGIAQVYDAGTADTGAGPRAFIAMEYVRGQPLLEFARELPLQRRLETLRAICDAVQHAHQHGVIHRDLKPANVIVDESGQPKVLDFGVARADFDASSGATLPGELVGTLPYMSPEQVSGAAHTVDTRCDVYALGLIGFELVAGRSPYDFEGRSWPEIARAIREDEPLKLGALDRAWRGDLETIFAKALEKDRERRYASAAELGADIERYLRDEPIAARAPTTLYQIHKFARRNRVLVAGVTATFVALVLGVIGTTWKAVEAREAERVADQRLTEVSSMSARVMATLELYREMMQTLDPLVLGRGATMLDALERVERDSEQRFAGQPELRAAFQQSLGSAWLNALEYERAVPHFESASRQAEEHQLFDARGRLFVRTQLASALQKCRRVAEAEPLLRETLASQRAQFGDDDEDVLYTSAVLVDVLVNLRQLEEAQRLADEVREPIERSLQVDDETSLIFAGALQNLLFEQGRSEEAEQHIRSSWERMQRTLGDDHVLTLSYRRNLDRTLVTNHEWQEAESSTRTSLEAVERVHGPDSDFTSYALANRSDVLRHFERWSEAEPLLRRIVAIETEQLGATDKYVLMHLGELVDTLRRLERGADAEALVTEAQTAISAELGESPDTVRRSCTLVVCLATAGAIDDAVRVAFDNANASEALFGPEADVTLEAWSAVAGPLRAQGKLDEAADVIARVFEATRSSLGLHHQDTLWNGIGVAAVRTMQGRLDEADALLVEIVPAAREVLPPGTQTWHQLRITCARLALVRERFEEAERWLTEAWGDVAALKASGAQARLQVASDFVRLYTAWPKDALAAQWRVELDRYASRK